MDVKEYLLRSLNMALNMQGESIYNNSFDVEVSDKGFYFIPRMPAGFVVDENLYQTIFNIANVVLYPFYTLLKQNTMDLVALNTKDLHTQRALFYPWIKGASKRLVIPDLVEFVQQNVKENNIPIMKDYSVNYNKIVGIAIAGNSGSGKTNTLVYILQCLKQISSQSNLIVVDPKMDTPTRWAIANNINVIYPKSTSSKSDFVSQVNDQLNKCLKAIYLRQKILLKNPNKKFNHITIAIDEVMALTEGINKKIKDDFFSLLSQVALLGRATCVHLVLVSQRFDYNTIPVSVREQLNLLIQLGNINKKTTSFLFPDLDPNGIVIPSGKGTGLIQVIDNEHPYQVLPLLSPTYYLKGNIL